MNKHSSTDRTFAIRTLGYDEAHVVKARSRSAARYRSYLAFHDATGFKGDFLWFCKNSRVEAISAV